ncbi:SAM-dependent methyltransferase [Azohydromonas caseinilytica]|uniref:SAM-dependent methyltransferase n=1 Tax=Azohydromonas caseinilytica TaxID=2728836 RepID=A0A848FKV5_9BURK|nr:SAM-dependent methyltransferase [Azohydromonas caseinilytica]NML18431.1 SAM-dependent methyltransferase [Azohydromonas caseinilytica]
MELKNVVPWGRSLAEYQAMFALSEDDLSKRILGCGDGPASFNAEVTAKGGSVISFDPVYAFSAEQLRSRIAEVYPTIMEQLARNSQDYLWDSVTSVEHVGRLRMQAMDQFLADYETGLKQGRYVQAALPALAFENQAFDLALCSHFLFLYSSQVSREAHLAGVRELCRVAREVRVYPLISLEGAPSPHLPAVMEALQAEGFEARLAPVPYRFQKGATEMLVLRRA